MADDDICRRANQRGNHTRDAGRSVQEIPSSLSMFQLIVWKITRIRSVIQNNLPDCPRVIFCVNLTANEDEWASHSNTMASLCPLNLKPVSQTPAKPLHHSLAWEPGGIFQTVTTLRTINSSLSIFCKCKPARLSNPFTSTSAFEPSSFLLMYTSCFYERANNSLSPRKNVSLLARCPSQRQSQPNVSVAL